MRIEISKSLLAVLAILLWTGHTALAQSSMQNEPASSASDAVDSFQGGQFDPESEIQSAPISMNPSIDNPSVQMLPPTPAQAAKAAQLENFRKPNGIPATALFALDAETFTEIVSHSELYKIQRQEITTDEIKALPVTLQLFVQSHPEFYAIR